MAELKLIHFPAHSLLPSSLYLDHSHCPVLAPATLAALPSTRAIPDRDVFYVAHPVAPFTFGLKASSVVVTDRRRRQCRGLSRGARLRSHRASRRIVCRPRSISFHTTPSKALEWSRPSRARQEKFQSNDTDEQACELAKIARRDADDQDVVEHHASFFPRLSNRKLRVTP